MAILVIIRGNSGSGKTTLAKALQSYYGSQLLLVSQDMVRRDMLSEFGQSGTLTIPLIGEMARFGFREDLRVVLEGFYERERYEPMLTELRDLFGDKTLAYYYDLSFEETVRRHNTRDKRHDFGPSDMKRWWKDKDMLHWSEEVILGDDDSLESVLSHIKNRLSDV